MSVAHARRKNTWSRAEILGVSALYVNINRPAGSCSTAYVVNATRLAMFGSSANPRHDEQTSYGGLTGVSQV